MTLVTRTKTQPNKLSRTVSTRSLFDHAWNRVRDFTGMGAMDRMGVGMHEARHWHRRAYGGVVSLKLFGNLKTYLSHRHI
jgi:hypothetical protein